MFWFSCLRNTKQRSKPQLSNKRGVFEVACEQAHLWVGYRWQRSWREEWGEEK